MAFVDHVMLFIHKVFECSNLHLTWAFNAAELVKTPFSSATDAESALRRHPSCAMLQSHFSSQSGLPNTLSQASSLHSSLTLPEIPMPLLEPAAEAAPEVDYPTSAMTAQGNRQVRGEAYPAEFF